MGNRTYTKNDNDRWVTSILTARTRVSYEQALNRRVSPGNYSVTGSVREAFTATETFRHYNKPVTITAP